MKIEPVIKEQQEFVMQVLLTLIFLKVYANNPDEFEHLLSADILEDYKYHQYKVNSEYLWETLDEIACDITHGDKKVVIKQNGLFPCLVYAKTKKRGATVGEIIEEFAPFSNGPWSI